MAKQRQTIIRVGIQRKARAEYSIYQREVTATHDYHVATVARLDVILDLARYAYSLRVRRPNRGHRPRPKQRRALQASDPATTLERPRVWEPRSLRGCRCGLPLPRYPASSCAAPPRVAPPDTGDEVCLA